MLRVKRQARIGEWFHQPLVHGAQSRDGGEQPEPAAARGEVKAEVTSAHPLSDAQLKALAAKLKAREGQDVTLSASVDPAILGGLIVKIGSTQIDSSIRTRLNTLANAMKG